MNEAILARLHAVHGCVGFYYKNLITGETAALNAHAPLTAASVIKIPVMIELMRRLEERSLDPDLLIEVKNPDRVPICGVLTFFHEGAKVTPMDLCWLMITISDNMATNLLIDLLGIGHINETLQSLGLTQCVLRRKLFETRPEYRHLHNTVSAGEIGQLLEMMYRGELISKTASARMLDILSAQQCSNKLPLLLPDMRLAHKTGEDDGITHDCGILFAMQPFVLCFCTSGVDTSAMNLLMAEIARDLCAAHGGPAE
ncbi:MAG: serine hydrolase [Clostridiaceae bacterium]|nr:serine hydrolase [Clostridiaceae bacterium]